MLRHGHQMGYGVGSSVPCHESVTTRAAVLPVRRMTRTEQLTPLAGRLVSLDASRRLPCLGPCFWLPYRSGQRIDAMNVKNHIVAQLHNDSKSELVEVANHVAYRVYLVWLGIAIDPRQLLRPELPCMRRQAVGHGAVRSSCFTRSGSVRQLPQSPPVETHLPRLCRSSMAARTRSREAPDRGLLIPRPTGRGSEPASCLRHPAGPARDRRTRAGRRWARTRKPNRASPAT